MVARAATIIQQMSTNPLGIDAGEQGEVLVVGERAHGLADSRPVQEQEQQDHQDDRRRDRDALGGLEREPFLQSGQRFEFPDGYDEALTVDKPPFVRPDQQPYHAVRDQHHPERCDHEYHRRGFLPPVEAVDESVEREQQDDGCDDRRGNGEQPRRERA